MSSIIKKSTVYNGWRHFYFIYGPLVVLAVCGLKFLIEMKKPKLTKVISTVVALQLIFSAGWIAINPFKQFAYYNLLAVNAEENFEYDYWNVSATQCLIKLAKEVDSEKIYITSTEFYSYEGLRKALDFLPEKYAKRYKLLQQGNISAMDEVYVLSNPTYQNLLEKINKNNSNSYMPVMLSNISKSIVSIKTNGVTIMEVYKLESVF